MKYEVGPDIDLDEEEIYDSRGNRVTEASAEAYVLEAVEMARRGRPALSESAPKSAKSPQVSFRLPDQMAGEVRRLAEERGVTVSQFAREALSAYVNRLRGAPVPATEIPRQEGLEERVQRLESLVDELSRASDDKDGD